MAITGPEVDAYTATTSAARGMPVQASRPVIFNVSSAAGAENLGVLIVELADTGVIPEFMNGTKVRPARDILDQITGLYITPDAAILLGTQKVNGTPGAELTVSLGARYYVPAVEAWRLYVTNVATLTIEACVG